jgi:hypothetical protein
MVPVGKNVVVAPESQLSQRDCISPCQIPDLMHERTRPLHDGDWRLGSLVHSRRRTEETIEAFGFIQGNCVRPAAPP